MLGANMRLVAVPWQVFQMTRSSVAVGVIGLVEVVPLILISVFGGVIADKVDRRKLIGAAQVGLTLTSAALALVALSDRPSLVWIYVLTALSSSLNAIDRPARNAMVPMLVSPGKVSAAMALRQVVFQITQIAGPAIGGLLIASVGVGTVYWIDSVTFLAALYALRWVPPCPPVGSENDPAPWAAVVEGLRFAFTNKLILSIFLIDLVAMIFGMPRAAFPALAESSFGMGAEGVGLLYAAPSMGALVAALASGWVGRVVRQGRAVLVAVTLWGAAITAVGLVLFSLPLTLFFLALAGAADVVSAIFRGTMLQEATPDRLRGRVSALNIMVVTGGPRLGDLEAGVVAGTVGAGPSVVIGGAACLLGTAAVAGAFPSLRRQRATIQE